MSSSIVAEWLASSGPYAIFISILLNTAISLAGVLPSVFLTAANITVFGFETGLFISFLGECIGAAVSFWLYRKGIQKLQPSTKLRHKWLVKLRQTEGKDAFVLILMLRILPFLPSGLINVAAAMSRTSILVFITASSLGKLPALFIEAYSVKHVLESSMQENIILVLAACFIAIVYFAFKRKSQTKKS